MLEMDSKYSSQQGPNVKHLHAGGYIKITCLGMLIYLLPYTGKCNCISLSHEFCGCSVWWKATECCYRGVII